ncbi:hypothetical protein F5148DRAFT_469971 [Russula earlei]|uniref:Uncharacterized protein n=1 Tax=Russula earlei TaxID=71964 RepID=A0ACC0UPV8_9AGAM|nr:hypothetical protein F5148DRAFT_469971 [Russula earlei]
MIKYPNGPDRVYHSTRCSATCATPYLEGASKSTLRAAEAAGGPLYPHRSYPDVFARRLACRFPGCHPLNHHRRLCATRSRLSSVSARTLSLARRRLIFVYHLLLIASPATIALTSSAAVVSAPLAAIVSVSLDGIVSASFPPCRLSPNCNCHPSSSTPSKPTSGIPRLDPPPPFPSSDPVEPLPLPLAAESTHPCQAKPHPMVASCKSVEAPKTKTDAHANISTQEPKPQQSRKPPLHARTCRQPQQHRLHHVACCHSVQPRAGGGRNRRRNKRVVASASATTSATDNEVEHAHTPSFDVSSPPSTSA